MTRHIADNSEAGRDDSAYCTVGTKLKGVQRHEGGKFCRWNKLADMRRAISFQRTRQESSVQQQQHQFITVLEHSLNITTSLLLQVFDPTSITIDHHHHIRAFLLASLHEMATFVLPWSLLAPLASFQRGPQVRLQLPLLHRPHLHHPQPHPH